MAISRSSGVHKWRLDDVWLWLLPPIIGIAIWVFRDARGRGPDLGSVSAQWLHEYRQTHQDG
jgi:hypothetical protein